MRRAGDHERPERDLGLAAGAAGHHEATPTSPPSRNPRNPPTSEHPPAEPAQGEAEDAGELDVPEAHAAGLEQQQQEVEGEQGQADEPGRARTQLHSS